MLKRLNTMFKRRTPIPTVWYISRTLPTAEDPVRGCFVIDQAEALAKFSNVNIEILNLRPLSLRGHRGTSALEPARDLNYPALPFGTGHAVSEFLRLFLRVVRRGRPTLVHGHWSSGLRGVAMMTRFLRIPLIVTEHGGPFPSKSPQAKQCRRILNRADVVISVSEWLKDVLLAQGVCSPIVVIPNAISDEFSPKEIPIGERIHVVAIARLDGFDKGVPEIIDAVGRLSTKGLSISLTIVGDGNERSRFEELAKKEQVPVLFRGTLTRSQISDVLEKSHILVSGTKDYETFGVAVAEALGAGRPVVATGVGAIPELVRPGINGVLIQKTDVALIASGIEAALEMSWNPFVISDSVAQCRSHCVARKLHDLYETIVPS